MLVSILSEFFVKCLFFSYNGNMIRKLSILGTCLIVFLLILGVTPNVRRHIRLEEAQVIPKVTTTEWVQAVPDGDIGALLLKQKNATIIFLNAKNTELNKQFDLFINEHPDLGIKTPIYVFQDLYRDKFVTSLGLDDTAINMVKFKDGYKQSVIKLTDKSAVDQKLVDQLKQLVTD